MTNHKLPGRNACEGLEDDPTKEISTPLHDKLPLIPTEVLDTLKQQLIQFPRLLSFGLCLLIGVWFTTAVMGLAVLPVVDKQIVVDILFCPPQKKSVHHNPEIEGFFFAEFQ